MIHVRIETGSDAMRDQIVVKLPEAERSALRVAIAAEERMICHLPVM